MFVVTQSCHGADTKQKFYCTCNQDFIEFTVVFIMFLGKALTSEPYVDIHVCFEFSLVAFKGGGPSEAFNMPSVGSALRDCLKLGPAAVNAKLSAPAIRLRRQLIGRRQRSWRRLKSHNKRLSCAYSLFSVYERFPKTLSFFAKLKYFFIR